VAFVGDIDHAVAQYSSREGAELIGDVRGRRDRQGSGEIRCTHVAIRDAAGTLTRGVRANTPFEIVVNYEAETDLREVAMSIDVEMLDGTRLVTLYSGFRNEVFAVKSGGGALSCHVAGLPLRPDAYSLNVFIGARHGIYDFVERAMSFEIAPSDVFGTGRLPERHHGPMLGDFHWRATERDLAHETI
jgi:lipopolysaccharide transport system ATP-binding protein